ncbi:unnamed protein product [Caenorhabditis nigoni]
MSNYTHEEDNALLLCVLRSFMNGFKNNMFEYAKEDRKLSGKSVESLERRFNEICHKRHKLPTFSKMEAIDEDALKIAQRCKVIINEDDLKSFQKNYDVTYDYVITSYKLIESDSESGSERVSEESEGEEDEEEESDKEEDKTIQNLEEAMENVKLDDKK